MNGGILKAAGHGAIAALAGFLLSTSSARAADLGGNCCADLEERVAELEATTARKGNRRVSLTISGQVNTAVMAWDQGDDNAVFVVDNAVSRSGFNFLGSARINPNLTAGFEIVVGMATGARSHQTSQADDDGGTTADSTHNIERANWYLTHSQLGSLRVGRLNSAVSGTTQVDLGGAGVIANVNAQLWTGNFFITQNGVSSADLRWSSLMGGSTVGISGLSRQNAVSYTTPTLGGFSIQVAAGENDAVDDGFWDVALRYAGEFSGFRVAAAISYGKNSGGTSDAEDATSANIPSFGNGADIRKWQGSASILHVASGLYATGAYVNQSYHGTSADELVQQSGFGLTLGDNRPDTTYWYVQGGVSQNWTGMGKTVVYGEYGRFEGGADGLVTVDGDSIFNSEVSFWGVGIVQHIDAAAMELFLAYRLYSASFDSAAGAPFGTAGDMDDMSVIMSGARISF
jgi:hypothetical protein